jgi:hypothetical protein
MPEEFTIRDWIRVDERWVHITYVFYKNKTLARYVDGERQL